MLFSDDELRELLTLNERGYLTHRENQRLEFKESFGFHSLPAYAKTMAAFSNNQGGVILFGVSDNPRKPVGLQNDNFENADPAKITVGLNEYFSPEIIWDMSTFEHNGLKYGVISVQEAMVKPVICKKNGNELKEGEIYYRYRGRKETIKYPEIQKIFDENREKERKSWMEHIEKIAKVGPHNIALIDIVRGSIGSESGKEIVIDKKLLKEIKFIQEGKFVEKDGAPALKLIGNVQGVETYSPDFNLDKDFYLTKELADELGLLTEKGSALYMTAVIWKYDIQSKTEYYQFKSNQKYYSRLCLEHLREKNLTLDDANAIYKEYLKR